MQHYALSPGKNKNKVKMTAISVSLFANELCLYFCLI